MSMETTDEKESDKALSSSNSLMNILMEHNMKEEHILL